MILSAIEKSKFSYMAMLPIDGLIDGDSYKPLWNSFIHSFKHHFPDQRKDYMVIKEIQGYRLHLHGIFTSDKELDCDTVKGIWLKFLKKHGIAELTLDDVGFAPVTTPEGAAKYVTKDTTDMKGIQLPVQGLFKRLMQKSKNFNK
jgi:hypothetical protein